MPVEVHTFKGYLTGIDKYDVIHINFTCPESDELKKLQTICGPGRVPYTVNEFQVRIMNKRLIDDRVRALVGRLVQVRVSVNRYKLISKFEDNLGETVQGTRLVYQYMTTVF